SGSIRYVPSPVQFIIRPNAYTSSGQVTIDAGGVSIDGNAVAAGNLVALGQLRGQQASLTGNAPGTSGNRVMYIPTYNPADSHYYLWADAAGAGSDNSRLWLDGPNGGEVVIGPRSGASRFGQIRLRADNVVIDT